MRNRDVTKSVVIISITIVVGAMFVSASSLTTLARPRLIPVDPPAKEWEYKDTTIRVRETIVVENGESLEIKNATLEMQSANHQIGIQVVGELVIRDSVIKSTGNKGYFLEVLGAAIIQNSSIDGVKSSDPLGEGIMVYSPFFRLIDSKLHAIDSHAITFRIPALLDEKFIVRSEVGGVMSVSTMVHIDNSSVGDLAFEYGRGDFHLWNSEYTGVRSTGGMGQMISWRFIQVRTSEPNSNLTITDADGWDVNVGETNDDGYFGAWWISHQAVVDPVRKIAIDHNPYKFEARKVVEEQFMLAHGKMGRIEMGASKEYYGVVEQNIEENQLIEIEMELK